MLLWHGSGESAAAMAPLGEALAHDFGLRCIAPDAPGHGEEPRARPEEYLPSRLAKRAAALLDERGVDRVAWIGHSWGASVGCRFAALFRARTRALVLLEGGHLDFRDLPRWEPPADADPVTRAMVDGLLVEPAAEVYPALASSRVPVLVVSGADAGAWASLGFDPLARLRNAVPQAETRLLAGAGHELPARADVAALVGEWLAARA